MLFSAFLRSLKAMVIFYMFKKCVVLNLFYDLFFANYVPIKRRVISEFTAKKRRIMHIYPLKSI